MKNITNTIQSLKATADVVVTLSVDEAAQLPNLLGRICAATLQHKGYYTATVDGVKTLYVRA